MFHVSSFHRVSCGRDFRTLHEQILGGQSKLSSNRSVGHEEGPSAGLSPTATPSRHPPADVKFALDPVLDFMRLLWSIEHDLQRMSKRMKGELGITGPQRLVLR